MESGGLHGDACHVLGGWRVPCGGRPTGGTGYSGSGTNHCLLVSFPLLSELLSRTAPTGRKEQGWMGGGVRDFWGCACVQRVEKKGVQQAVRGLWWGKRRAGAMQESE